MRLVPVKTVKQQARLAWHRAREELGLDPLTFSLYWYLHGAGLKQVLLIAQELLRRWRAIPTTPTTTTSCGSSRLAFTAA